MAKDQDYQRLIDCVMAGIKPETTSPLQQYWKEEVDNLRWWVIELANEGHVGGPAANVFGFREWMS